MSFFPSKRVVTACAGRFHLFDQAKQLEKHQLLYKLVTDYPSYKVKPWGLDEVKVCSSSHRAWVNLIGLKLACHSPFPVHSSLVQKIHSRFARSLSGRVPTNADVLIVHSSFMLEALEWSKENEIVSIVDHGSLHEQSVRDVMLKECYEFGFKLSGNCNLSWLIRREESEFRYADHIFVCSQLAKQSLVNHGVSEQKIFINQLGVDLSVFTPAKKYDSKFRVIYCSGVSYQKGIHYLLRAFHELRLPDSELWILGSMTNDPTLRKYVEPYWGEGNIFYKGTFPQSELRDIYAQGSVFVLPSLADGWGMVVLQAMACGLPVIVSNMTGACEAVDDGVNGYVIPSQSVDAIKEKILLLYESAGLRKEMGRNASSSVVSGYNWDDYGNRLFSFLTEYHAA